MQSNAMQRYAVLLFRAVVCYAMLCYAMLCYAMQCNAMQCYAVQDAFRGGILADGSSGFAPFRVALFYEEIPLSIKSTLLPK